MADNLKNLKIAVPFVKILHPSIKDIIVNHTTIYNTNLYYTMYLIQSVRVSTRTSSCAWVLSHNKISFVSSTTWHFLHTSDVHRPHNEITNFNIEHNIAEERKRAGIQVSRATNIDKLHPTTYDQYVCVCVCVSDIDPAELQFKYYDVPHVTSSLSRVTSASWP